MSTNKNNTPLGKSYPGVLSDNKDWFRFCAENGTWERVLVRGGIEQGYRKEIAITVYTPGNWSDVFPISLHIRTPSCSENDVYTHYIPHDIVDSMMEAMTYLDMVCLLDSDIMSLININKLSHYLECTVPISAVSGPHNPKWINSLKANPALYKVPERAKQLATKQSLESLVNHFSK